MTRIVRPDTAFQAPRQKRPRVKNNKHLEFIRSLPCLVCGLPDHSDPHHIKPSCEWSGKPHSGTHKPDDCFAVPLCRPCHNKVHKGEIEFWRRMLGTDPFEDPWGLFSGLDRAVRTALALWAATGDYERGCQIVKLANR